MKLVRYFSEFNAYVLRVVKIGWGFLWNLPTLLRVPHPIVTVFGSGALPGEDTYVLKAYEFGRMCAAHGISVITGGGPSIMLAANRGAASIEQEQNKKITRSLGIGVRGVDENFVQDIPSIRFRYFFMRKWYLTQFSSAIVVFPGGIGTLDELFDVLNLRKHHMLPAFPIVFIGVEFWTPLIEWLRTYGVARGIIRAEILEVFKVTDDMQEAFELVQACYRRAPVDC